MEPRLTPACEAGARGLQAREGSNDQSKVELSCEWSLARVTEENYLFKPLKSSSLQLSLNFLDTVT